MGLRINNKFIPAYGDNQAEEPEKGTDIDTTEKDGKPDKQEKGKIKKSSPGKFISFFTDTRVKSVIGIGCLLFAALLLISCISYLMYGAADQSLIESRSIIENAKTSEIRNEGGPFGAAIANILMNKGFGLGAFFLIYLLLSIGLNMIGKYKLKMTSTIMICLVATITTSSIIGLATLNGSYFFPLGGEHGKYLNEFLISVAGIYGAIFLNIFLLSVLIALCINSLKKIYRSYDQFIKRRKAAQINARQQEEEEARNTFASIPANSDKKDNGFSNKNIGFNKENHTEETKIVIENTSAPHTDVSEPDSSNDEIALEINQSKPIEKAVSIMEKPFDPTAELSRFKFPPSTLLHETKDSTISVDIQEQEENKERITKTLGDYGIEIKSIKVSVGPTVTLYEIIPAEGVRISKIKVLEDDIALSLAALGIRIIAPIPGKGTIGIEVPNKDKQTVSMRSIIESKKFQECKYKLPIAMGCTISNDVFIADLTKMPHILVAGATGMGKSVGLNAIITSLLYKKHPSELKFVMIDPKMVEFSMYAPLEYHYIAQMEDEEEAIITNMNKAVATLNSLVQEMENRLLLLSDAHERNIHAKSTCCGNTYDSCHTTSFDRHHHWRDKSELSGTYSIQSHSDG